MTGKNVDGDLVKVVKAVEPFTYITLEDGTEITVRTTVTEVVRQIGQWNNNGDPIYNIAFNTSITTDVPKSLRKENQKSAK